MTSLHVKHRPTSFAQVLGQADVVASLRRAVKDKRAHAYIFTGPSGTGKTTLARILADAFTASTQEIDGATNSGADAIRDVVSQSNYRAIGTSGVKAIIIDEAHRLSAAAWTCLLKPIEEPPGHVFWFFCTTEEAKIPKTIQTRCLRYRLKPLSEELLLELLITVADAEGFEVPDPVFEAIAEASGGSPRQALVYLESCLYAKGANEARRLMQSGINSREAIDLCRWLVAGRAHSWPEAVKYLKALNGTDAESVRINVVNYLTVVLMGTKDQRKATFLLTLLEPFLEPYTQSDKLAPLMRSIGLALGMDRL